MKTENPIEEVWRARDELLAEHGMTQLRIAETEKYAHVTFFFSGGREDPYPGEERILVPSPAASTMVRQVRARIASLFAPVIAWLP